jgi:uncharacterized Zn finger protein (UPF0148 family)
MTETVLENNNATIASSEFQGGIMEHCDRCGAQGKFRFTLKNGEDLVFCWHHSREYEFFLPEADIVDLNPELVMAYA